MDLESGGFKPISWLINPNLTAMVQRRPYISPSTLKENGKQSCVDQLSSSSNRSCPSTSPSLHITETWVIPIRTPTPCKNKIPIPRSSILNIYHRLLTFGTEGNAVPAWGLIETIDAAAIAPCCPAGGETTGGAAAGTVAFVPAAGTVAFVPAAGAGDIAPISGIAPRQEISTSPCQQAERKQSYLQHRQKRPHQH